MSGRRLYVTSRNTRGLYITLRTARWFKPALRLLVHLPAPIAARIGTWLLNRAFSYEFAGKRHPMRGVGEFVVTRES